jgi:hypothetical protein
MESERTTAPEIGRKRENHGAGMVGGGQRSGRRENGEVGNHFGHTGGRFLGLGKN